MLTQFSASGDSGKHSSICPNICIVSHHEKFKAILRLAVAILIASIGGHIIANDFGLNTQTVIFSDAFDWHQHLLATIIKALIGIFIFWALGAFDYFNPKNQ